MATGELIIGVCMQQSDSVSQQGRALMFSKHFGLEMESDNIFRMMPVVFVVAIAV